MAQREKTINIGISLSNLNFVMEMPILHPIPQNVNIRKNLFVIFLEANSCFFPPPCSLPFSLWFAEPLPVTYLHDNYSIKGHDWNLYMHLLKLNITIIFL